ncbi:MAG: hypothetical protein K8S99_13350 [Planctomycetes bacterium]|nr:hypothetical protein [Planctomycetota bacterium]
MHIVTLSYDDGFAKSSLNTAEIYEKFGLAACINVVAAAHLKTWVPPDYKEVVRGDFTMWNELQERGHEVMPHGYRHANKGGLPFNEGRDLILRCLDVFDRELRAFDRKKAIFNFPYNNTTPELEAWLPTQVRAFRGGGAAHGFNPLPTRDTVAIRTTGMGPGNCEEHLDACIAHLFAQPSGWLVYNTHGLDDEGWGPIGAGYLERLLGRLLKTPGVHVLPTGAAMKFLGVF